MSYRKLKKPLGWSRERRQPWTTQAENKLRPKLAREVAADQKEHERLGQTGQRLAVLVQEGQHAQGGNRQEPCDEEGVADHEETGRSKRTKILIRGNGKVFYTVYPFEGSGKLLSIGILLNGHLKDPHAL